MANNAKTIYDVIVVGAGFGGLGAAIECRLRGWNVTLIEKYFDSNQQGDILDFFPNGGLIISRWDDGKVGEELLAIGCTKADYLEFCKYDGKLLYPVPWFLKDEDRKRTFAGHRGQQWSIVMAYAQRLGVTVLLGTNVVDYREDDASNRAGVMTEDGRVLWADCIIAADGPRSLARKKVLGLEDEDEKSGWAIFRSFFSTDEKIRAHPDLQNFIRDQSDTIRAWSHDQLSMLAYCWNEGKEIAWVLLHPDEEDIEESWSLGVSKDAVSKYIEVFPAECKALLETTPPGRLIDFKLVYHPPLQKWTSHQGRIILIGDAAHANLPTAGQGASQALEDAAVIATCLDKAQGDVKLALEVTQRLRYHRSNKIHASGRLNIDAFYKVPWEAIEKNPKEFSQKRFTKIRDYDARAVAEEAFDRLAQDVRDGKPGGLEELALPLPPEGVFMPWDSDAYFNQAP